MVEDNNSDKEKEKERYELLGKMFVHYTSEQNMPSSPRKFYGLIPEIAKFTGTSAEEIQEAYFFLFDQATALSFSKKRTEFAGLMPREKKEE